MDGNLDAVAVAAGAVSGARRGPPAPETVASWEPPLSGDIPIRIRRDAVWEHAGREIRRESLWRLFAALLRRESDGCYYLVTPVEKWRIEVEAHPLLVVDLARDAATGNAGAAAPWIATLNSGARHSLRGTCRLRVPGGEAPWRTPPNGRSAARSRAPGHRLGE